MITKVDNKIKFSFSINDLFNASRLTTSLLTVGLKDEKGEDLSDEYTINNSHKSNLFMECLNSSIGRLQPLIVTLSYGIVDAFKITETEATITLNDNNSCDSNYLKMIDKNMSDLIVDGCILSFYEKKLHFYEKKENTSLLDVASGKYAMSYSKFEDSVFNLKKKKLDTFLSDLRW